jgi:hypothetical protein
MFDEKVAVAPTLCVDRRVDRGEAGQHHQHHGDQRRLDAADAALVEARQRKARLFKVVEDDAGDQVTGDHEKYVDADEAAGQRLQAGVVQHHGGHGDRAQAVDLGTIGQGFHAW